MMRLLIYLLPLLFAPACFSSTPKEEHFYHLTGPTVPLERGTGPTIELLPFGAASGYDSPRLAYRVAANELRFYAHHKWAANPAVIVREILANHLRASGRFSLVGMGSKGPDPDATLSGTVVALEEVDAGKTWKARIALRVRLRLGKTDELLLNHGFDVTVPCKDRHPREVALSISRALEAQIKKLAPRLADAILAATSMAPITPLDPSVTQPTPAPTETVEGSAGTE